VLTLLGTVDDEVLFRLCDLVVDGDTAGALVFVEELSEQGQDLGRLVTDLLEHLRHLMLVRHMGEVPDTLPVTEEARERLREQANQLPAATVVRLIDLLHVAVEDMRQGGDPRLPLELALVKVTRASSDLSRESLAFRIEQLEAGGGGGQAAPAARAPRNAAASKGGEAAKSGEEPGEPKAEEEGSEPEPADEPVSGPTAGAASGAAPPALELEHLQEAWRRSVLPAVEHRSVPASAMLMEAHPSALAGDTLTLEFPPKAGFHRDQAEDPRNRELLKEALYEVTGRRLEVAFVTGEPAERVTAEPERPATEEEIVGLIKSTFDARELER
jgi:DNA polymerase III subunit gamma/tau